MPSKPLLLESLTHAAWREISEKSGLPDEARPKVVEALYLYRAWHGAQGLKRPADTKRDLRELAKTLERANAQMSAIFSNLRGKVALINSIIKASADGALKHEQAQRRVESWISQIDGMLAKTLRAEESIAGGRRGAWEKARVLAMFVRQLDQVLLEFTGSNIDRSNKGRQNARDYITAVCRVADANISPSSIDEAMKAVITGRGRKRPRKQR
jgi:hypothetical protein